MPTCIKCETPLGHDSVLAGHIVCHEHRLCNACHQVVSPPEISYCIEHNLDEIKHARCLVLDSKNGAGPILNPQLLNLCILLFTDPSMTQQFIHNMNFDQRYIYLQASHAVVNALSIQVAKDLRSKYLEDNPPENIHSDRPAREHRGPKNKKQASSAVESPKIPKGKLSSHDKAVLAYMKMAGISREEAEALYATTNPIRSSSSSTVSIEGTK